MEEKVYRMGKRFQKYCGFGMILCSLLIFCFYFLYDILLVPRFPVLDGTPLVIMFWLIEAAMMGMIYLVSRLILARNYYVVTTEGLMYVSGEKRVVYRWTDFQSVERSRFEFSAICPIHYMVNGQKLQLNQYLDDIWGLNREIMKAIEDHVAIDSELMEQVMYMA